MKFQRVFLFIGAASMISSITTATPIASVQDEGCSPSVAEGAIGDAIITNTCTMTVFLQSVAGTDIDPVVTLTPGMSYSEEYRVGPNNSGVAIKLTDNIQNWATPMLLEYGLNEEMNLVFYDMSVSVGGDENGDGGIGTGYELTPSTIDTGIDCVAVNYQNSYVHLGESDDATKSCDMSTSLTLDLC